MEEINQELIKKLDGIISRIDVLINAALKSQMVDKKTTMREQISYLNSLGLDYKDIARIICKSSSYVSSELTVMKKKSGGR